MTTTTLPTALLAPIERRIELPWSTLRRLALLAIALAAVLLITLLWAHATAHAGATTPPPDRGGGAWVGPLGH